MTLRFEHLPFYKYNRYHQICRYLQDAAGRRSLVFDLSMTHDRFGSSREHFFSPRHHEHKHTHARRVFASSFSTGPPGDRGALQCLWNVIATQPIGLFPFQARGILPVPEEQSRLKHWVPHGSHHTGLGSSSLIAHVLHYPPPPTRTAL